MARGGDQVIPRPPSSRIGEPAPWAHLDLASFDLSLAAVCAALAHRAHRRSPLEGRVTRASAVVAPLYERDGQATLVLTRRARHMRTHRGEVSFPGGGQEPGENLRTTALRETEEEIGLPPAAVQLIGELDHLATIMSNSFIAPFVGRVDALPDLTPAPAEVELILHVGLRDLLDPDVFREEWWGIAGLDRPITFFEIEGDTVWGATGAMVRNLLGLVTGTHPGT